MLPAGTVPDIWPDPPARVIRYLTELSLEAFLEAARNVPYQQIESDLFSGVDLTNRRDDLIDPIISGNKAYKLIFNLLEARN